MILTIRKIISNILYYSGITCLANKIGSKKTLILAYHRVLNPYEDDVNSHIVSSSIDDFKKQMEFLSKRYNVISLEKFLEYHKKKEALPKNSVVITFDDGYKDNYLFAYPILKKYNFPATIFLSTGAIDKNKLLWWDEVAHVISQTKIANFELKELGKCSLQNKNSRLKVNKEIQEKLKKFSEDKKNILIKKLREILEVENFVAQKNKKFYLTWEEVKEMNGNNISFGSHTVTHPILTKIPIENAEEEIQKSKESIEKNINKKVILFGYPNGGVSDFNNKIKNLLKENSIDCAVTYIPGRNSKDSDLLELRRMFVNYGEDILLFKNKLIGIDAFLGNIYFSLKRAKEKMIKV